MKICGGEIQISIEGGTPMFDDNMKRAQQAVKDKKWPEFNKIMEVDKKNLLEKFDLFGNTPIHVATRSKNPQLFKELLEMLPEAESWRALRKGNHEANTVLHEAIFCKRMEMVDVIFDFEKKLQPPPQEKEETDESEGSKVNKKGPLLEVRNNIGETPLFRAAKYGKLKMLKHLAKHASGKRIRNHFHRSDSYSILHACVAGQFFDVAIWLVTTDESLAQEQDKEGLTCLQLLSKMPYAFGSQATMESRKGLIYFLLPEEGFEVEDERLELHKQKRDLEYGQQEDAKLAKSAISRINYTFWKRLAKVFDGIDDIWKLKKTHKLAERLADLLVKKDLSWQNSYKNITDSLVARPTVPFNVAIRRIEMDQKRQEKYGKISEQHFIYKYTPLLIAASTGIKEIVEKILHVNPEAICHISKDGQNVLHMAVKHRQRDIFRILKKKPQFKSLVSLISREGRTILHQVAMMDYYRGGRQAGVAFHLQDELSWYHRVKRRVPLHYYTLSDDDNLTAGDVLDIEHAEMLKNAQKWLKETAQSCSTVAVLIATVVFAAAYTIPGGTEAGNPVFLHFPVFLFFTTMDVVALATSLAAVVMFLSILTSPFELWDFHKSLPRKLSFGFTFLFISLLTTMLAFSATILITIRLEWKQWTSTLIYSAAFLPVTIFGLIQFPLYVIAQDKIKWLYKHLKKVARRLIKYFKNET